MIKQILATLGILGFAASAVAARPGGGLGAGDGGQSIVCGSLVSIISADFLDLYEWRQLYNLAPSYGSSNNEDDHLTLSDFVRTAESRFDEAMIETPEIHALFKKVIAYINNENSHLHYEDRLESSNDTGPLEAPIKRGCFMSQAALFNSSADATNPYVMVSENIWMAMDSTNAVSLLIHEIFHSYFPEDPVYGTLALRQFVGFLSSPQEFRDNNAALFVRLVQTRQPQDPASFKALNN